MILSLLTDIEKLPSIWGVLAALFCVWPLKVVAERKLVRREIPVFKPRWLLYSWFLSSLQFIGNSGKILKDGYKKFAGKAYWLPRLDGDMIILPPHTVQEISSLPPHIANRSRALARDFGGHYTAIDIILKTVLHQTVIQRKITPRLASLAPLMEEELNLAVEEVLMPLLSKDGWTNLELYHAFLAVVARVFARASVGTAFCRNQEWLDTSVEFVESLISTSIILRSFPPFLQSIIARFLPAYWKRGSQFRTASAILGPYIQAKLDQRAGIPTSNAHLVNDEPCALNWLVEIASDSEANVDRIAQAEILLSFAGVHTILSRQLTTLYDLAAHPESITELRSEIQSVAATDIQWTKSSYHRLAKMDSFIRESQRCSPTSTIALKRVMEQDYVLQDGTFLPKGAYICVDAINIENDPVNTPDPDVFDGLRGYRLNQAMAQQGTHKHDFAMTEPTVLGFGHGRTACPGRHMASMAIKMCLVKWLSEFEFRFPPGKNGKEEMFSLHEFVVVLPWWKMEMRPRVEKSICPF